MFVELEVTKGKVDVGDLSRTTIVVLNDDKFPMNVKDTENEYEVVKGFIMHNYHFLKNDFWWACACKLVPGFTWAVSAVVMKDVIDMLSYCVHSSDLDDPSEREVFHFFPAAHV